MTMSTNGVHNHDTFMMWTHQLGLTLAPNISYTIIFQNYHTPTIAHHCGALSFSKICVKADELELEAHIHLLTKDILQ